MTNIFVTGFTEFSETFRENSNVSLQIVAENKHQIHEAIKFYNEVNEVFVEWLTKRLTTVTHGGVWKYLLAYKMLILSKENFGISTTIGIEYYTIGSVSKQTFLLTSEATEQRIHCKTSCIYHLCTVIQNLRTFGSLTIHKRNQWTTKLNLS